MPCFLWTIMMIIIHSLTNNEPVSISAVLFIYSFFTFYITYPSPLAVLCCLYLCYLTKGPKLWMPLPDGTIVAERWAHNLRRSPSLSPAAWNICKKKREGENNFCLWFMVSTSGTLLVDSLNCPSRAKHTPLKKSIHTSLCVCLCFFSPLCAKSMCFYGVSLSIMKENDEEYHITLPRQA